MSDHAAKNRAEAMPINLKTDKMAKEYTVGATVSRESSFSSVELGASNSVSRESSFSSSGSGIFDGDSSHPASRSSSWRSNEDQLISSVTDQQYQRLHNARARFRKARQAPSSESSSTELLQTPPERTRPMTDLKRPDIHGRSCSEPELDLSLISSQRQPKLSATSPDGLVISTPSAKGFIEYRLRSRSFTGSEHSEEERPDVKALQDFSRSHLQVPDNGMTKSRGSTTEDKTVKNVQTNVVSEKDHELLKKERDDLREKLDNLKRECDRLQCERDAVQLERDLLLQEKEQLQAELNNRNDVIQHLQDHVNMSLVVSDDANSATKRQQRSKSEVRRPAFYFPGEITKTNAYTCL